MTTPRLLLLLFPTLVFASGIDLSSDFPFDTTALTNEGAYVRIERYGIDLHYAAYEQTICPVFEWHGGLVSCTESAAPDQALHFVKLSPDPSQDFLLRGTSCCDAVCSIEPFITPHFDEVSYGIVVDPDTLYIEVTEVTMPESVYGPGSTVPVSFSFRFERSGGTAVGNSRGKAMAGAVRPTARNDGHCYTIRGRRALRSGVGAVNGVLISGSGRVLELRQDPAQR
ncbi:MAG: hypothetical protein GF331_07290 [Chitinivibrionales bacterium]|nr:hypothetical protein [Chitinivibrionales bacterium]